MVRLLGDAGVDLKVPDADGNTVAHYAAQVLNGKHILSYLHTLYNDYDFNYQNKRRATAAYNAAWKGQMENLKVLRRVGADLSLANSDGNQCVIGAAMNDQPMVLAYLLDEAQMDVDYANDCQETATFWSASNGCVACLRVLVEHRANLEKCDKYGITALMVAAEHGEAAAMSVLLEAGADVNHQNQDGETALMKACAEGFLDCVKALMEKGVDHSVVDDEGNSALLWCCMTGNMDIFKYLVQEALQLTRADIEQMHNNDSETCIDWIVENNLEVGLEVLQQLGIEVEAYADADEDEQSDYGDDYERGKDGIDD